ncbi:DNA ligase, partial [Haemophilus influenzae]
KLNV